MAAPQSPHNAQEPEFGIRKDWRLLYLIPGGTFLLVMLFGLWVGPLLFLNHVPDFGPLTVMADAATAKPSAGLELAARQQLVTTTFLLMIAAVLMIAFSVRTVVAIVRELRSDTAKTDAGLSDYILSIVLVVIGLAGVGLLASLRSDYCGLGAESHHLYRCMGVVVPGLIEDYLNKVGANIPNLQQMLDLSINVTNIVVVLTGACMLFSLLLVPRGFDRTVKIGALTVPERISAEELKRWLAGRTRMMNALSLLATLVLVAGIAQMFGWMNWPLSVMTKDLIGDNGPAVHESYQALESSVLQFHGAWFGMLVAALIFPTNMLLLYKSRLLGREIVAADRATIAANQGWLDQHMPPNAQDAAEAAKRTKAIETATAEIAAAEEIIDQANAEATFKGYFDNYRGYLLALAPAIAQKLLTFGS